MRFFKCTVLTFALSLLGTLASAQGTFMVTGTPIPADLLQQNYGKLPKGMSAYDLNICNVSASKQSIVSSEVFQALARSNAGLQPIGRQIMLASILRNQNRSLGTILNLAVNSAVSVLSVLNLSKQGIPAGAITGATLGGISVQTLLNSLKPVLTADQLEKFEDQVLEPALVLDAGSCVERTVFAIVPPASKSTPMALHVR